MDFDKTVKELEQEIANTKAELRVLLDKMPEQDKKQLEPYIGTLDIFNIIDVLITGYTKQKEDLEKQLNELNTV